MASWTESVSVTDRLRRSNDTSDDQRSLLVPLKSEVAGRLGILSCTSCVGCGPVCFLASVGMTEDEAREKVGEVKVGKFPFTANGRARAMDDVEGSVKVIGDAGTDRLLGVHILGARASDMIAEAAVMIEMAASVEDLARSVHAHPTLPEAVKEAALAADKRAIHF